jgi:hypothetical protein
VRCAHLAHSFFTDPELSCAPLASCSLRTNPALLFAPLLLRYFRKYFCFLVKTALAAVLLCRFCPDACTALPCLYHTALDRHKCLRVPVVYCQSSRARMGDTHTPHKLTGLYGAVTPHGRHTHTHTHTSQTHWLVRRCHAACETHTHTHHTNSLACTALSRRCHTPEMRVLAGIADTDCVGETDRENRRCCEQCQRTNCRGSRPSSKCCL